ncbi:MAG: 50S ribosomal protein L7/L12 [candidate division TM6 bacterium GW2011_GWF2_32_72]|nr:MAG: 50S ribosomal protein L7/L12 [candidate division TM6 bacterium GW2011_GWF2_32_72]
MSTKFGKLIDEIGNMTVLELSDLVKELEEKFGVSAAMPMSAPAAGAAAPVAEAVEEKSEYNVVLKDAGPKKIETIKALRVAIKNLGLSDAKKMAEEGAPVVIAEGVAKAEAQEMKKILEEAGAKVELV